MKRRINESNYRRDKNNSSHNFQVGRMEEGEIRDPRFASTGYGYGYGGMRTTVIGGDLPQNETATSTPVFDGLINK